MDDLRCEFCDRPMLQVEHQWSDICGDCIEENTI